MPKLNWPQSSQKGAINLIDLLIALVITSTLMGIALPSYERLIEAERQRQALNFIQIIIQQARVLASLTNQEVRICPAASSRTCSASNQSKDLLLLDSAGQVLRFYPDPGHSLPIAFTGIAVTIRPLPRRSTGATILPCSGFKHHPAKAVTFSATGRPRINHQPPQSLIDRCY